MKIANRSFENLSQFKRLGTAVTNEYLIQEEVKRRMNSGNVSYHSVQKLLSSCLLSTNVKIRIKELRELYTSPGTSIIRIIKSRRMRLAGHVAQMGGSKE
jgi:hypothetical protein